MGVVEAGIGAAVGLISGYAQKRAADKQRRSMERAQREAEQRQLALEARANRDEKRSQALSDANLLRQRQRALVSSSLPKQGTSKTGASGVLGSAPKAGKSALGI
jgi:hypothetical protein